MKLYLLDIETNKQKGKEKIWPKRWKDKEALCSPRWRRHLWPWEYPTVEWVFRMVPWLSCIQIGGRLIHQVRSCTWLALISSQVYDFMVGTHQPTQVSFKYCTLFKNIIAKTSTIKCVCREVGWGGLSSTLLTSSDWSNNQIERRQINNIKCSTPHAWESYRPNIP